MVLGEWLGIYLVGHAFKRVTKHGPQCHINRGKCRDTVIQGQVKSRAISLSSMQAGIRMDHDASKSFSPLLRIMLADDHLLLRQGVRALLERDGFRVVGEAGDGREAIQIAQQTQPDFAVLDVMMPLLNGLDVIREIRRVSPQTKSLLLTMHTDDAFVLESR
jgi:CheY-like chemotaxis protein